MPRSDWTREAIRKIEADFNRCADTHLIPLDASTTVLFSFSQPLQSA